MAIIKPEKTYPYKFLDAYTKDDAKFFFGREEETRLLYEMVFQSDIIVVYGASGTGKTSLIQCGLANQFQPHDWLPLYVRRANNINDSLEKALSEAGTPVEESYEFAWIDEDADKPGNTSAISRYQSLLRSAYLNVFKPVYLIFDQFEEIFVLGSKEEQQAFYQSVQEMLSAGQPAKLVFSIREEYLGYLFDFEKVVPGLLYKKLRIEQMDAYKVRKVIQGTTGENSLVSLKEGEEEKIADDIFNKIRENDKTRTVQLPYLQVFLDKIYMQKTNDKNRQTQAFISIDDISKTGDIGDVLRDFLEERIIEMKSILQMQDDKIIWEILSSFVTIEGTKEPIVKTELSNRFSAYNAEQVDLLINELFKNKILRYSTDENTYEIAHDSLAKQIAERRSDEEIALLEVKRLLKNQVSIKPEMRDFFSANQLQLISGYSYKLDMTDNEMDWVEKSKKNLLQEKDKERFRLLSILGLVVVALGIAIWFLYSTNKSKIEIEKSKKEIEKAGKINRAKDLMEFGDNYKFLGKKDFACDSYQKSLDSLQDYKEDDLYKTIKRKLDSLGCTSK